MKEWSIPDLDQIKQGKQEVRHRRGRFAKGRSGNPAGRPRGCREAAVALAAFSDTPELQHADGDSPAAGEGRDRARGDAFKAKILALARGFTGGPPPDVARASFAELFAWSLTQSPAE